MASVEKEPRIKGKTVLMRPGVIVLVLNGRFAGRKAVIVKSYDEGSSDKPFGHALVVGIERYPRRITRKMTKKRRETRCKIKPFCKVINYNHLMPTRYSFNMEFNREIVNKSFLADKGKRRRIKNELRTKLREKLLMEVVKRKKNRIFSDVKSLHSKLDTYNKFDSPVPSAAVNVVQPNSTSKYDRNSGIHLVGPMYQLTAMSDRSASDTFDTVYPISALTKGPTLCSFGLEYNDHNYALPTGLTPPTMAPHLLDYHIPLKTKSDFYEEVPEQDIMMADESMEDHEPVDLIKPSDEDDLIEIKSESTTESDSGEKSIKRVHLRNYSGFDSPGATPAKKSAKIGQEKSRNYWSTNSSQQEKDKNAKLSEIEPDGTRYRNAVYEGFIEMRCEPERKVIEVPEYLCVSPSKISDLDSDDEAACEEPFGASGKYRAAFDPMQPVPVSDLIPRLVNLFPRHWQHLDCMMAMYSEIEARHAAVKQHRAGGGALTTSNILQICGERPVQQSIAVEVQRRLIEELELERVSKVNGESQNPPVQSHFSSNEQSLINKRTESRIRSELASFSTVTPDKFMSSSENFAHTNAVLSNASAIVEATTTTSNSVSPLATKGQCVQSPSTAALVSDRVGKRPV
ncbi:60S ribosomal protein L27, partial [Cichlidogyrus casuarinus]